MILARFLLAPAAMLIAAMHWPAHAQIFSDEGMFNVGLHAGRVTWGIRFCGSEASDEFKNVTLVAQRANPRAYQRGFDAGLADAEKAKGKHGREVACLTVRMLYGPNGTNLKGLVR